MNKIATFATIVGTLLCLYLPATSAHAQATRTWVSGTGDDANPCSRTAPCKTFAGSISKTAPAGVINCIDPGGFGAVTITKSITIDCTNTLAGILVSGTNAINIPTAGVVVNLRGLDIEGIGTGLVGVNITAAARVHIEKCRIFGFQAGTAAGINLAPTANGALLVVTESHIHTNGTGIIANGAGGTLNMHVRDTVVDLNSSHGISVTSAGQHAGAIIDQATLNFNSGSGLNVSGSGTSVFVGNSTITGNVVAGVANSGGSVQSFKNNQIAANTTDGTPLTAFPGPGGPLQ